MKHIKVLKIKKQINKLDDLFYYCLDTGMITNPMYDNLCSATNEIKRLLKGEEE